MAEVRRGVFPPILTLLDAVEAHRGAFEYDWRTRFHIPFDVPSEGMGWGEAWRLFLILGGDPSSQVASAVAGWQYPASRDALVLLDLFDLTARASFKRPKAYARPWDDPPKKHGTGRRDIAGWKKFKARKQAEYARSRQHG